MSFTQFQIKSSQNETNFHPKYVLTKNNKNIKVNAASF